MVISFLEVKYVSILGLSHFQIKELEDIVTKIQVWIDLGTWDIYINFVAFQFDKSLDALFFLPCKSRN